MRITRIDIKRDDSILQVENWPSVERNVTVPESSESEISAVNEHPVCQDGVCQLGEWKPRRAA
ncbi:MAG: hypothetical protein JSS83_01255 [Cyanobacteria bacterium SZAS LIN-3]|nr:hypothetical protein [Cyanobacteria bacterium SZAS LIN-3]MBS2005630.1 hypothetical protein [Cyanobacteria bacterium SZAS TMP-1]